MPDEGETRALMGTVALGSMLSALGVLFLIGSALWLGKWRKSYWRVVLALAVCDLTAAISFVSGALPMFLWLTPLSIIPCNVQATMIQLAGIGTLYYPLAIACMLYFRIIQKVEMSPGMELIMHLIWIPFALLSSLIPLYDVGGVGYDDSVGWCWIKEEPTYGRFVYFYAWTWLVMVTIFFIYARIFFSMRRAGQQIEGARLTEIATGSIFQHQATSTKRLLLYPLAFVICWIPATINRTVEAFGLHLFPLIYLECFFVPLQGIVNTGIYLYTSRAHQDVYHALLGRPTSREHSSPYASDTTSGSESDEYSLAEADLKRRSWI